MNEERLMILQMLAAGKISVEEAEQLILALAEGTSDDPVDNPAEETGRSRKYYYESQSFPDFERFLNQGCPQEFSRLFDEGFKACQTFKIFAEGFPFWGDTWGDKKKEWQA